MCGIDSRRTMPWSVLPYLLLLVGCFGIAIGLKPCQLRSIHCLSSTVQQNLYACAERGHFRHPDSVFRYYDCHGAGYAACDCSCRYRDMCFDPQTRRCQFAFLHEFHNCTLTTTTTSTTTIPSTTEAHHTKPVPHRRDNVLVDARTYDLKYRFNNDHHTHRPDVHPPPKKPVPGRSFTRNYNFARKDILTAQEVLLAERGINPQLVDDISIFPAWAVAVVVLCVVMLLVMMVIFLY